jgi:transcriptional regulator with XRE-family HTH domain
MPAVLNDGDLMMNNRIKQLRLALNMTQEEFASYIGVKRNTVSVYESGRNTPVTSVINLICSEFNVNKLWLLEGKGTMFHGQPHRSLDALAESNDLSVFDYLLLEKFMTLKKADRDAVVRYVQQVADAMNNTSLAAPGDDSPASGTVDSAEMPEPDAVSPEACLVADGHLTSSGSTPHGPATGVEAVPDKASTDSTDVTEASMRGNGSEASTRGSGSEASTRGSGSEASTRGSGSEASTRGSGSEASMLGSSNEVSVRSSGSEASMLGSGSEEASSLSTNTSYGSGGHGHLPQLAADKATEQPDANQFPQYQASYPDSYMDDRSCDAEDAAGKASCGPAPDHDDV